MLHDVLEEFSWKICALPRANSFVIFIKNYFYGYARMIWQTQVSLGSRTFCRSWCAVDFFKCRQNLLHRFRIAGIVDCLCVATCLYQALCAKLGQMLRQCGLAQPHLICQNANWNFAFDKAAKNHKTLWVCHC
jgi:hypothetical protein